MKARAIWLVGLSGWAVVAAGGLYMTLPGVERDVRQKVLRTLDQKGLNDVRAKVDGQTVTLTAMDNDPASVGKLAQAKTALAGIENPSSNPGTQWLTGAVTQVHVGDVPQTVPASAPKIATPAVPAVASAPVVAGERATTIDSVADRPSVAGLDMPISSNAAQGCEERILKTMGDRKLSYTFGTYQLAPESNAVLDDVYKVMASCPAGVKVTVAGYTDNAGDATANQLISKARAQAAADALVARGFDAGRVDSKGFGAASPVADNSTPDGRAANRRVVFLVSGG
jgi:outer membrane protein OmpA-like peptidoglycan-associated protein